MKLFDSFCEALTRALGLAAFFQLDADQPGQQPLGGGLVDPVPQLSTPVATPLSVPSTAPLAVNVNGPEAPKAKTPGAASNGPPALNAELPGGPVFSPSNSRPDFVCDYSAMKGWVHDTNSRGEWLRNVHDTSDPRKLFDINTDYENATPIGKTRKVSLVVNECVINADGFNKTQGKCFNTMYPGPWIEACWGDTLEVTVTNKLQHNGTTIHWHGVRQLHTMPMDGVNGVTQCPIAPADTFTYIFKVLQYGSSWYHSHYSLQYPDGLAGPMTFHGPSSANYDLVLDPFLISDWSHNSAFEDFHEELVPTTGPPAVQSLILNGRGTYCASNKPCITSGSIFNQTLEKGKRYLIRLINTSTESMLMFSIDNHVLQVIGTDYVPIRPYYTDSIMVAIGQRYHVVMEARPSNEFLPIEDQNYWIRATPATGCGNVTGQNETIGVIRYDPKSTKTPTTTRYQYSTNCTDEPYQSLVPVVPWQVGSHANDLTRDSYDVGLTTPTAANPVPHGNFSRWEFTLNPMWLNFGNPTINNLDNTTFDPEYVLVPEHGANDWVYLIISANITPGMRPELKKYIPVAHPIHLHGHDFAILAQLWRPFRETDITDGTFQHNNPPRRDVALLPSTGYLAIAFRLDNPGTWLLHCHIAWHASSGLAMQILERQSEIKNTIGSLNATEKVCMNWKYWFSNRHNWFNPAQFQEDSGV